MKYAISLLVLSAFVAFSARETSVVMTPQQEEEEDQRVFSDTNTLSCSSIDNGNAPTKNIQDALDVKPSGLICTALGSLKTR